MIFTCQFPALCLCLSKVNPMFGRKRIEKELEDIRRELRAIWRILLPHTPTRIIFTELTMNPTAAGETQVFTGTLVPTGAQFPSDSVFAVNSNDPAVSPSVDSTGLVVTVTYPAGWTESATTPLEFSYTATSASTGMSLSATITPSAPPPPPPPPPPPVPTGISFAQTS